MLVIPIKKTTADGRNVGLTLGRVYEVLGIEADHYRILSDGNSSHFPNDPLLYEPDCFKVTDSSEPEFWLDEYGEEGERYAYPESWARVGFFEDYHDQVPEVREQFWKNLRRFYPKTWEERRVAG